MIRKSALVCLAALSLGICARPAVADTGIFGSFVVLTLSNANGGAQTFYDLGSATANPDYSTLNGSVFGIGDTFTLNGGELQTFKNNNNTGNGFNDVGVPTLLYTVSGGGVTGNFQLPFNDQFPNFGNNSGDQKWQSTSQNFNLLTGLAPGSYTLTIRITAPTGTSGDFSGGNVLDTGGFVANFNVVPEPSTNVLIAALSGVGCLFLLRRRRRAA